MTTTEILPMRSLQAEMLKQEDSSLYAKQIALEELFFKNNTMRRLKEDFSMSIDILTIILDKQLDKDFAIMFLVHVYLRKQADPSILLGCLLPYAHKDLDLCAQWIENCVDADLADWNPTTNRVIFIYEPEPSTQADIDLLQYHLPLVLPPLTITNNMETGHINLPPSFVVTNKKPDNNDYCLDIINTLNSMTLYINPDVALGIQNTWKNCCWKPGDSRADFVAKQKALAKYNKHAKDILSHYIDSDYRIYFSHFYDTRGRIYPRAYYINPQGNNWNKASIEKEPEMIDLVYTGTDAYSPLDYLKADIANNFGIKGTWEDRIAWADANASKFDSLVTSAKDPAMFFASIAAYADVMAGRPTGYLITIDASASGLQWLAVLSGCEKTAFHCNLTTSNQCQDAYINAYDALCDPTRYVTKKGLKRPKLKKSVMTAFYASIEEPTQTFGEPHLVKDFFRCMGDLFPGAWDMKDDMLELWNPNALEHSWVMPDNFHVSTPVMESVKYEVDILDTKQEVILKENLPKESSRSLGPNMTHSVDSYAMREMIRRCNKDHRASFKALMTNFANVKDAHNIKMVNILWGHYLKSGLLSIRIMDYLDSYTMALVDLNIVEELVNATPKKQFQFIDIHDAFRLSPNYAAELQRQYNRLLYEVAKSDLFVFMANQFHHTKLPSLKGKLNPNDILGSKYALH